MKGESSVYMCVYVCVCVFLCVSMGSEGGKYEKLSIGPCKVGEGAENGGLVCSRGRKYINI